MMKTFQSLFPPLSPHSLSLSSARRVVLISYNAENGTVEFRHYLITVKPYGVSKRIRRILEGATAKSASQTGMLDLGSEKDVADFLLRRKGEPGPSSDGYESAASSASSAGGDDGDAVDLADDYVGRNNKKGQKRAVRLDEIGPRMELRLIKIVEGVPGKEGGVLYHDIGEFEAAALVGVDPDSLLQSRRPRPRSKRRRRSTRQRRSCGSRGEKNRSGMCRGRKLRKKGKKGRARPVKMVMTARETR